MPVVNKLFDAHVHLRQDSMMKLVLPYTYDQCSVALVMPNTKPPILGAAQALDYRRDLENLTPSPKPCRYLMTGYLTDDTTPHAIAAFHVNQAAVAMKLYPAGVTTNSAQGVKDVFSLKDTFEEMQKLGMVLCIHGEHPEESVLERETAYIDNVRWMLRSFPELKICIEHVSTARMVDFIAEYDSPRLHGSITLHHLMLTLDDVIGDTLRPHHFCKPVAKMKSDRSSLRHVAFSGHMSFHFGSDSAPHAKVNKECECGAAGIFTAPVLLPLLYQLFMESDSGLVEFTEFTYGNASRFYGNQWKSEHLSLSSTHAALWNAPRVELESFEWEPEMIVSDEQNGGYHLVPFCLGRKLRYRVKP